MPLSLAESHAEQTVDECLDLMEAKLHPEAWRVVEQQAITFLRQWLFDRFVRMQVDRYQHFLKLHLIDGRKWEVSSGYQGVRVGFRDKSLLQDESQNPIIGVVAPGILGDINDLTDEIHPFLTPDGARVNAKAASDSGMRFGSDALPVSNVPLGQWIMVNQGPLKVPVAQADPHKDHPRRVIDVLNEGVMLRQFFNA